MKAHGYSYRHYEAGRGGRDSGIERSPEMSFTKDLRLLRVVILPSSVQAFTNGEAAHDRPQFVIFSSCSLRRGKKGFQLFFLSLRERALEVGFLILFIILHIHL